MLMFDIENLTLSPLDKLSSVKLFDRFNLQRALMLLEVGENVVHVSDDFDPDETQSYSVSHPDPSRFAYGIIVVSSR